MHLQRHMLISSFISTCSSHGAFKLKSRMDARLSPLCFLPPGLSISEGNTTLPPVIQAPKLRDILDLFFFAVRPQVHSTRKSCRLCLQIMPISGQFSLPTASNPLSAAGASHQDLLSALRPVLIIISYNSFFPQQPA